MSNLRLVSSPTEAPSALPATNIPAEDALLSLLIFGGCAFSDVEDLVRREMFTSHIAAKTFQAISALAGKGREHRAQDVAAMLQAVGVQGFADYAHTLGIDTWSLGAKAARDYATNIRKAWIARQSRTLAVELQARSETSHDDIEATLAKASEGLATLLSDASVSDCVLSAKQVGVRLAQQLRDKEQGLRTGFRKLDEAMGGLRRKQTTIVAARTSVGKSMLASQIARFVAKHEGVYVLYVSMEMAPETVYLRMVSAEARVNGRIIRQQTMQREEWSRFTMGCKVVSDLPIRYNQDQSQSIADILQSAAVTQREAIKAGSRLGLIVVDHIGLVRPAPELAKATQEVQVGTVSRSLRGLADRFDCHVIGLCQIGRGSEKRQGADKHPKLFDLRDSGRVENDADNVIMIHRDRDERGTFKDEPATITLAKGRVDCELVSFEATCEPQFQTFSEVFGG